MQDHDDNRHGSQSRHGGQQGWRSEDRESGQRAQRDEGRSFEPPYGDDSTYGRQGQRGGYSQGSNQPSGGWFDPWEYPPRWPWRP